MMTVARSTMTSNKLDAPQLHRALFFIVATYIYTVCPCGGKGLVWINNKCNTVSNFFRWPLIW